MSKFHQKHSNPKLPLRVGVTGGIGSGKTTVCRIFESLGVPVYYADDRAKAIMTENKTVVKKITELFGSQAYLADGTLNRSFIAGIVFHDKKMLESLNAIVHPAVFEEGERWNEEQTGAPYTIKEAALLFESGGYKKLDKVITVFAPQELRIGRVMKRDGVSEEAVLARIKNQMADEEKIKLADFVIYNDGKHSLVQQIWQIHQQISSLTDTKK